MTMAANDNDNDERKQKVFRAVMAGLAAGSGVFLGLRWGFNLGVDPSLISGTGVGIAVAVFLLQRIKRG
jgi:hypothetical protein